MFIFFYLMTYAFCLILMENIAIADEKDNTVPVTRKGRIKKIAVAKAILLRVLNLSIFKYF